MSRRFLGGAELEDRPAAWLQLRLRQAAAGGAGAAAAAAQGGAGLGAGAWAHKRALGGHGGSPLLDSAAPHVVAAEVRAAERGAGLNNPYVSVFDVSVRDRLLHHHQQFVSSCTCIITEPDASLCAYCYPRVAVSIQH